MGKYRFKGGVSGKDFEIRETTSGEVEIANVSDNVVLFEADETSIRDASGVSLANHASRHAYNGADPIDDDALRYKQIQVVFGTEQTVSVGAGSTQMISEGVYIARCGPNTSVEYSPDGGTTWYTLISTGGIGIVFSDGSNVRFNNVGTSAEDSYLLPIA